jgi:putative membrane protein
MILQLENSRHFPITLLAIFGLVLGWSAINPHDYFTWFLEVLPALLGLGILLALYPTFAFSNFTYFFVFLQAIILVVGGHYTYAENPGFNWIRDTFSLSRNYYDRLGHFFQGFTPALIAREYLIRKAIVAKPGWLPFFVVCICLAASAGYEFLEWWVALYSGESASAFLGTQGDVWDTQWDMFMALIGAVTALAFFSGQQDRWLAKMAQSSTTDHGKP